MNCCLDTTISFHWIAGESTATKITRHITYMPNVRRHLQSPDAIEIIDLNLLQKRQSTFKQVECLYWNIFPNFAHPWRSVHYKSGELSWISISDTRLQYDPKPILDKGFSGIPTTGRELAPPGSIESNQQLWKTSFNPSLPCKRGSCFCLSQHAALGCLIHWDPDLSLMN